MTAHRLPPGPKPSIFGQMLAFGKDAPGFLQGLAQQYGDISHFKLAGYDYYLANHPDLVKDVLVTHSKNFAKSRGLDMAKRLLGEGLLTSEGDFHIRQRRLAQPTFHRERIAAYGKVMTDYAVRAQARWQDGQELDMAEEMMRLTLAVAGKTLFDADVEAEAGEIGEALTTTMLLFERIASPVGELLDKLPLPSNFRVKKAIARLDQTVYRIIEERRKSEEDRGDLLSMLLVAQDEEGTGGGMTDRQVRDEAMTIFLAGHETTANALAWTWYLLSEHPEVLARLRSELDSVLGGRAPSVEDLPRLTYTRQVLSESMRIYPPAWLIGRKALVDYTLGEYTVPAGAFVLVSQYVMHRDPRFFPEPTRFDPDRWTPEALAARPKFSYFPFGGGPRVCIGEPFAWMEGVLILATLAQSWSFHLAQSEPVTPQALITMRPRNGVRMRLERRVGIKEMATR